MKPAHATLTRIAREFASFGGARFVGAIGLMVAGTLAEGIGIVLLVPAIFGMFGPSHPIAGPFAMLPVGHSLAAILSLFALLVAIRCSIVLTRERLVSRLQVTFVEAVRLRLVERLTRAAWPQVAELSHARVVQASSVEIHQIGIAVNSLMAATAAVVIVAGTALLALVVAPLTALIAFAILGFSYLPMRPMLGQIRNLGQSITYRHFGMTENAIDFLAGLKVAAAERTGPAWLRQQRLLSEAAIADRVAFASVYARVREVSVSLTAIAAIAIVGTGVAIGFPPTSLLVVLLMLGRMSGPLGEVQRGLQQLAHSLPSYERLQELEAMLRPAAAPARAASAAAPFQAMALSLENVSFSRGGRDMFRAFSMGIPPGTMIGIAGPSGVGKTTLLDLMAGILCPDAGQIRHADIDRTRYTTDLAYVSQDAVLSGRTLRESLSWSSEAETTDMVQALHLVGARMLLQRVGGIDVPLGERGAKISGGERQRVGLARALLRRPQLLLLDEALNALDPAGERDILATLAGLNPRPAIVLVAHRAEAFALCSQVIHLSPQRSPSLEDRSPFHHLVHRKFEVRT